MLEILRTFGSESTCPYLSDRDWRIEYRAILQLLPAEYEELLSRGWRRNGNYFFRPQCLGCTECRSLRVDVNTFCATKSQRRSLKRNQDVELEVRLPAVTDDHVRLYNEYHEDMTERRNWPENQITADEFWSSFHDDGFDFCRHFIYKRHGQVIGIGIVDLVPNGSSSVYFFHDPQWRRFGPGTFTILKEIEFARETGRQYVYLGYCIADCPSMAYKSRFGPHQWLEESVEDHHTPTWG